MQVGRKEATDNFSTDRAGWNPACEARSARHTGVTLLRPSLALDLLWDGVAIRHSPSLLSRMWGLDWAAL